MKVTFKNSRGFTLVANIMGLREGESLPAVIIAHGLQSSKESPRNLPMAEELIKNRIACLLFDFTGHGESEGDFKDMSIEQFVQDLDASIDYLQSLEGIDAYRIGLFGSSMGGTAALVKATTDKRIKVLALRSAPAEGYYRYAEHITIPTLIVQGGADPISVESKIIYNRLAGKKKMVIIKGADHLYSKQEHLEEAKDAIVSWFTLLLQ